MYTQRPGSIDEPDNTDADYDDLRYTQARLTWKIRKAMII